MAARKRRFKVIVAESAPSYTIPSENAMREQRAENVNSYFGHEMASELVKAGLDVTLIPDAAIFAVMSRVNKVILGTHAVLANGGLLNLTGSRILASAARHHHIPVVICTGLYKLAPIFPYDEEHLNSHASPDTILPFANGNICFLIVITMMLNV